MVSITWKNRHSTVDRWSSLMSIFLVCLLSVSTVLAEKSEDTDKSGAIPVGSCQPSNAMSVFAADEQVFSFVPKGAWLKNQPGVDNDVVLVNLEPNGVGLKRIPTEPLGSCASNSRTGQTVCTTSEQSGKNVYLFAPPDLKPTILPSQASGTSMFFGGLCTTCAVTMDAIHNKALLSLSLQVPPPGVQPPAAAATRSGFQFIDLGRQATTETAFRSEAPPTQLGAEVSKGILIDPIRNWILSPNESLEPAEGGNFEIIKISSPEENNNGDNDNGENNNGKNTDKDTQRTQLAFFENGPISDPQATLLVGSTVRASFASAAEDCRAGIALATLEGSDPSELYLVDLTQAHFTPGSPGTWKAPSGVQELAGSHYANSPPFFSGPNGIAIAQGTSIGLFTGMSSDGLDSGITAFKLSAKSGSAPVVTEWISCKLDPGDMTGNAPHTVNAYQSPNTRHAMGVIENLNATKLWRVDLTKMFNLPSTGHVCNSGLLPPEVLHTIVLP